VLTALRRRGHSVRAVGVRDDLAPLRRALAEWRPHAVFNLLMELRDEGRLQPHAAAALELEGVPFTGADARAIFLTRDKALAKRLLLEHGLPTPAFAVFPRRGGAGPAAGLRFPLLVKPGDEEASLGIAQASLVRSRAALRARVAFVHRRLGTDAIAEEYVEGRELTVSLLGDARPRVLPVRELRLGGLPAASARIATARAKFDDEYRERHAIRSGPARGLAPALRAGIERLARRVHACFGLAGAARLDLRMDACGRIWVIEVNATPDVGRGEDLAASARSAGIPYPRLLERMLALARRRTPGRPGAAGRA
jgi:D-alanine-D-alanine ligase